MINNNYMDNDPNLKRQPWTRPYAAKPLSSVGTRTLFLQQNTSITTSEIRTTAPPTLSPTIKPPLGVALVASLVGVFRGGEVLSSPFSTTFLAARCQISSNVDRATFTRTPASEEVFSEVARKDESSFFRRSFISLFPSTGDSSSTPLFVNPDFNTG